MKIPFVTAFSCHFFSIFRNISLLFLSPDSNAIKLYRYVVPSIKSHLIRATWFSAKRYCKSMGGDLASIRNNKEQRRVIQTVEKFKYENFWIGGNDLLREGRFQWSDGSPFSFTNWYPREPNNLGSRGQEDCVNLKRSKYGRQWNDLNCSFKHPFLCRIYAST